MNRVLGMLSMLIRENLISGRLQRIPEELLVMESQDQVTAWHGQGGEEGPMLPIYHLNALACSRLLPAGGTVVDLGCGSGRFSSYLARRRPDLKIVGFDLSEPMVDLGNAAIRDAGLGNRVELRVGDMTTFSSDLPAETTLVACQFALHHLPSLVDVEQCFREFATARRQTGCGFWIFDLARPRHASTSYAYPKVLTPEAPEVFQLDSTNSLMAAYSHAELFEVAERVWGRSAFKSVVARLFPLYQAFWVEGSGLGDAKLGSTQEFEKGCELSPRALRQYRALRAIFPRIPH